MKNKIISRLIKKEIERERRTINLIASENYVSRDVLEALGSVFTNKYAEGRSHMRYYSGNGAVDELEDVVRDRALKLFGLSSGVWEVNSQSYSGSVANLAVYTALVPMGKKIMGLELQMGGHLTHGHKVNLTGKLWRQVPYGVDQKTEKLDYRKILSLARKEKPALVVAGYTAYSRVINFKEMRKISDSCGAILMVDMSHVAGLVAGGVYPSPFPYADIVTTTTHKTLRGPRSAVIFSRTKYAGAINRAVFPGLQGGPHANQMAAVGVALYEASQKSFKQYARRVVKNAHVLADELAKLGWRIVSGGTDTHLFLVDTFARGVSGKQASDALEAVGITTNKNTIPFDTRMPIDPSGIRIGTPAITTRGMSHREMREIAEIIDAALSKKVGSDVLKKRVSRLTKKFPLDY